MFPAELGGRRLAAVAAGYRYFIRLGRPEAIDGLIAALDEWGNAQMAQAMLNSGDARLHDAARAWADDNGYIVIRGF